MKKFLGTASSLTVSSGKGGIVMDIRTEYVKDQPAKAGMTKTEKKTQEKQIRNEINRQVNCETANMIKVTSASAKQIAAIERALALRGIEVFPENLRETVDLRVAHPTASLAELAAMFDPPLSKPGLNHRLRKIMEIAGQVGEGE